MSKAAYTTPRCMVCGQSEVVVLDAADVWRWQTGMKVQDVWPDKTAEERELLQTGTHPWCWDELFGEEEDE